MTVQDAIDRLRQRAQMPLFAVNVWDRDLDTALRSAAPEALFEGLEVADGRMVGAVAAGLHLWNDNFASAHNLCQGMADETGSYWHGLCHRREGHAGEGLSANLSNSKYWFRRTGEHPAFAPVYRTALTALESTGSGFRWATETADLLRSRGSWDPAAMSDWFAQVEASTLSPQSARLLEEIQWREIDALVDWCLARAVNAP